MSQNKSFQEKYLLPYKAKHIQELYKKGIPCLTELKVEEHENAIILPYKELKSECITKECISDRNGWGGVIDCNNKYVKLSSHPEFEILPYIPSEYDVVDATVVYAGFFFRHWGHFLMDDVSRLWYALLPEAISRVDFYVFTTYDLKKGFYANCIEFFRLLNIDDKVILIDKPVQYSRVIVPQMGYYEGHYYSKQWLDIFDKVRIKALEYAEKHQYKKYENIYLDRHKIDKPSIGHKDLARFWRKNRYHILFPEEITLIELIWYLNNAKQIVIDSGTLPHHTLFCKDGIEIAICERAHWINRYQIDIDIMKQLNTTYIDSYIAIFPLMCGSCFFCYDKRLDSYAVDHKLKRISILQNRKVEFRRNLKKHTYACGYSTASLPDDLYMNELKEAYEYYKQEYSWLQMRPLTNIKTFVRKILFRNKIAITER